MSDDPMAVVRRMYDAANNRDFEAVPEIFAPDFYSNPMRRSGVEPVLAAWRTITDRFPALRVTPVEMISDGDRVAVWSRVEHGPGEPATMMEMIRVAGGRVAEIWGVSTLKWR
jgi:predicted SnoaL-like aldol condensation-catalyzing enzyme